MFHNGIATAIGTLTPALKAGGHRVTILAQTVAENGLDDSVYDLEQIRQSCGVVEGVLRRVAGRVAPKRTQGYLAQRSILVGIHRARKEQGIQVVEMEESFGIARSILRRSSVPICVRLHGPWFLNGAAQGYSRDYAFHHRVFEEGQAIRSAYAVTAVSGDVLNRVREFYGLALPGAQVIHGTTPAVTASERWRYDGAEPNTVLFVGRFDRHKGVDVIVAAFGEVLQKIPDAQLWLVGPDSGLVTADGRKWKIEQFIRDRLPGAIEKGCVRTMGFQTLSELNQLRRKAMVTVICSRYETFSSTTLESLTMGCPTIAAKVGGITELIRDQDTGLFYRPQDPGDLAAKILMLLGSPTHAAGLARRAGQDCQERFHPNVIANRFVDFFGDVVQRWEQDAGR